MSYKYEMKDRFNVSLALCKLTVRDFCNHIGIHENTFTRYISNNKISSEIAEKVEELGINSRWILIGKGNMYNETGKGKFLKYTIETNQREEENFIYFKIITWINTHYDKVSNFEAKYKLQKSEYFDLLKEKSQLSIKLSKALKEDGLNLNWIFHNDQCPYNFSKNGREKKSWALINLDYDSYIYKVLKGID